MLRPLSFLTAAVLLTASVLLIGCDSGVAPGAAPPASEPTVSFASDEASFNEIVSPDTITVVLNDPNGSQVSVEVLFAADASTADTSDFSLGGANAVGSAYLARTVTFPADAEDGATQDVIFEIADSEEEVEAEVGVFALQNAQGAAIGSNPAVRVTIAAEGTEELLNEDFTDDALTPFSTYSVADGGTSTYWETASPPVDSAPLAQANSFNGSYAADDWLISPALDMTDFTTATLSFLNIKGFDDSAFTESALRVKVSTDYSGSGSPANATWTDVSDQANLSPGDDTEVDSGDVDLTPFVGNAAVYVAFQYRSSGTGGGSSERQQVDNIVVQARK